MKTADRQKLLDFLGKLKTGFDPLKDTFAHYTDEEVITLASDLDDLAIDLRHGLEYQNASGETI
jgi:hypothetical protein